jgi:hypothetical protein
MWAMKPMPGGNADLGETIWPPAASMRPSTASMLGHAIQVDADAAAGARGGAGAGLQGAARGGLVVGEHGQCAIAAEVFAAQLAGQHGLIEGLGAVEIGNRNLEPADDVLLLHGGLSFCLSVEGAAMVRAVC